MAIERKESRGKGEPSEMGQQNVFPVEVEMQWSKKAQGSRSLASDLNLKRKEK